MARANWTGWTGANSVDMGTVGVYRYYCCDFIFPLCLPIFVIFYY